MLMQKYEKIETCFKNRNEKCSRRYSFRSFLFFFQREGEFFLKVVVSTVKDQEV